MSARSAMVQRATIERDMQNESNAWNQTAAPDWQAHIVDLPCRVWFQSGREIEDGVKVADVNDLRAIVPLGTDVTITDRIRSVTDRLGAEQIAGPLRIVTVGRRRDHLALTLAVV